MLRGLFFLLFIVLLIPGFSQRFGGSPPSIKWQQINTDTARIIFPRGLDSQANRIASIIHFLAARRPISLGGKLKKIDIVLQNQTTIANGYVGLGPFRSEFFLNPAMNNFEEGTIAWNDLLSIHEYRHVQQFNNFRNGLSSLMRVLFGEEGYALAINASIPDWFYEGDAVHSETALTRQGRGRLPLFTNAWPSIWQAGKDYSWMKMRNGSLKDYVPNHYHLGYLLVNYGYLKYGDDFWSRVTHDASAFKGLFYPFQRAVKKHSGVSYQEFREQAFNYYRERATDSVASTQTPSPFLFPVDEKHVTNYSFAQRISGDSLIYLKSAYNKLPAFYIRDSKGEHLLRLRDVSTDNQFSYRNGKLVYSAYTSDPRWGWRDYSEIRLLDIHTNRQRNITVKSRYFTPDISPSGTTIVAVSVAANGKSELHVLNATDGKLLSSIRAADILLFTSPKFIDENRIVSAVRLLDGKSALAISDARTGASERLTPPSFNVVGFPAASERYPGLIYFTASYNGNDDVFALQLDTRELFRVTDGRMGKYFVNANAGIVSWSLFTAEGLQLQEMKEDELRMAKLSEPAVESTFNQFPVALSESMPAEMLLRNMEQREFETSKYSKSTRLINFHSWRPYYEDPEFSFSLYGQNVLNTTETELYYLYNENENTHAAGANFTYGGWFPQLNMGAQYTFNRSAAVGNQLKQWGQADISAGLNIPLTWARGKWLRNANLGTNFVYRKDINRGPLKDAFTNISFGYLHHYASYGQQFPMARQHIFPGLGFNVNANARHAISNYESWQYLLGVTLYLPGIMPTHHIVITSAFQETDTLNTLFSNRFPYSRGYNEAYFARMWRVSGNYHFPVIYPDWGFANIFYLQRVRGNVFFDLMRVYSRDKSAHADQRSVGGEMYFDTKWWNQYSLTFGLRVAHLLDRDFFSNRNLVVEFILPVSILPR